MFGECECWTVIPYTGGRESRLTRQEIEQRFVDTGWELDGSFAEHLIIGYSGDHVSLLAHQEAWDIEDPIFEILDHEEMVNYWVRDVPTPQQAEKLLRGRDMFPEAWDRP